MPSLIDSCPNTQRTQPHIPLCEVFTPFSWATTYTPFSHSLLILIYNVIYITIAKKSQFTRGGLWWKLVQIFPRFGVNSVMPLEARETSKRLRTPLAVIRLIACVCPCVGSQRNSLCEAFRAMCTFEGLFSGVNTCMSPQIGVLGERLVAVLTSKRAVSGMCSDVVAEMRRFAEWFVTVDALKSLLLRAPLVLLWRRDRRWRQRR